MNIGIIDKHYLFRKGLWYLIREFGDTHLVVYDSDKLVMDEKMANPFSNLNLELLIVDPCQYSDNYHELFEFVQLNEDVKILFLCSNLNLLGSYLNDILNSGIQSIMPKSAHYQEVAYALDVISRGEFYYSETILRWISEPGANYSYLSMDQPPEGFSSDQKHFFKLIASDLTYSQIADKLHLSPKTIDFHRAKLFKQFNVKSRQGLVMEFYKRRILV